MSKYILTFYVANNQMYTALGFSKFYSFQSAKVLSEAYKHFHTYGLLTAAEFFHMADVFND